MTTGFLIFCFLVSGFGSIWVMMLVVLFGLRKRKEKMGKLEFFSFHCLVWKKIRENNKFKQCAQ